MIHRRISLPLTSLFLLAASSSAFAQFSGYFVELSSGQSQSEVDYLPAPSAGAVASRVKDDSKQISLAVGTRFNDNFAVEVALTNYGTFSGPARLTDTMFYHNPADPENPLRSDVVLETSKGEYEVQTFNANVIGSWPLARRLDVYGKLGLAAWQVESDFNGTMAETGDVLRTRGVNAELSQSGSSFQYAVGISYRFTLNYGVKLEYGAFNLDSDVFSSKAELDSFSIGLRLYL
ncbi:outer membrane beta-barrel protein [Gilvimarinus sp. F26214L]|uniref:outer membrane beta-barrel protein n=1 Tax=Gilvimarinus sp. DZF01 TaxID=3461371 RepID=UPI0040454A6F